MKKSQLSVMSAIGESKAARLSVTSASAVMAMAAIVSSVDVAATACTSGSSTAPVTCAIAAGTGSSFIVQALNFTGSNNVNIDYVDAGTGGFAACGTNQLGTGSSYGLTTLGGSMYVKTASATAVPTASAVQGSGCV